MQTIKPWSVRDLLKAVVLLLPLMGLSAWSGEALAALKYSRASAGWSTASTWSTAGCGGAANTTVPGAADNVTICTGHTITTSANSSALSLDIQSGGTLTQATNRTLTIGTTLNVAGLFTCQNSLTVAGATTVSGTLTIANIAGTKTLTGDVTISGGTWNETVAEPISFGGSLTNNGTFTASTGVHTFTGAGKTFSGNPIAIPSVAVTGSYTNTTTLTVATALSGAGSLTNGANQTLNLGGTTTVTTLNASTNPNTVNYYANVAQTVKATTYYHLTKSGTGTATAGGNLTVNGTLTVSAGTLALAATTSQINGPTVVTGTLSMTTGTKTFVGAVTVNAGGVWTSSATGTSIFRNGITHNGTTFTGGIGQFDTNSQTLAGSSAMTFAGAVTVTGPVTVTNNNTNTVTITGTLNGTVVGSSTFVNGASATLNYGAAAAPMATGVLTASASPNTVNYTGAAQTVRMPTAGYYHLTLSGNLAKTMPAGAMTVGGNFTMSGTATATAAGAMTVNGNFTVGTGTTFGAATYAHGIKGNFSNSGTFTASTSTVTLDGAAAQTIGGTVATTFYRLTVNNAAGVSLSGVNATASNLLTLQSGVVTTGAQILVASANCPGGIARTSGHVAGNLQLRFPTGAPSCTFHVGDASAYRPIDASFASVTTAGSLTGTVSQSAGEHPNIATSGLDSAADVNRYWTLTNPTGGTIAFTTYTATFNFINPGDFDVGATPANFEIERWNGAWSNTTLGTAGATSTSASGLPSFAAGASNDFAVGEKKPPFVNSIVLASVDPTAPATLVDWTVTFNSPVTGVDSTDFALVMGGGVSGATITGVAIVGGPTWSTTWTVTANTGTGAGTLGLNLVDNDSIVNAAGKPLAGSFTGQVYTVVYTASGFVFTNSACVHNIAFGGPGQTCAQIDWPALQLVAGQGQTGIWITSINTSGVPTRLHASLDRTRSMQFGLSCHNPVANAGITAAFAGATGFPLCQASGTTPTSWSNTVTVTFPGGSPSSNTSYTFSYADVGGIELWMRNSAITTETGNSGAFVVKPYGFKLALSCAGNFSIESSAYCPAGETTSGTVTATRYDSGQPNNLGAATPNFGQETTTQTVSFSPNLVAPTVGDGGTATAFADVSLGGTWTSGQTSLSLNWPEAGTIKFTPTVNYLGAGDLSSTGKSDSESFFGSKRFYPYRMALADNGSQEGYSGCDLTYAGQPFQLGFTLTARNKAGNAVKNYGLTGYTQRATGTAISVAAENSDNGTNLGGNVLTHPGGAAPSFTLTWPATAGADAVVTVAAGDYQYGRSTPISPLDALKIGFRFVDDSGDSVPLVDGNMDPATTGACSPNCNSLALVETRLRYGRLRLLNAYGSELLPLRVPVRAEYFSGTSWTLNAADNCTTLPNQRDNLAISNHSGTLTPANYGSTKVSAAALTLSSGLNTIVLAAPAAGTSGSADIALNLNLAATTIDVSCNTTHPATAAGANRPWLQGNWCGVAGYIRDPNARIKFGSPKAPYIYLRERY